MSLTHGQGHCRTAWIQGIRNCYNWQCYHMCWYFDIEFLLPRGYPKYPFENPQRIPYPKIYIAAICIKGCHPFNCISVTVLVSTKHIVVNTHAITLYSYMKKWDIFIVFHSTLKEIILLRKNKIHKRVFYWGKYVIEKVFYRIIEEQNNIEKIEINVFMYNTYRHFLFHKQTMQE